MLISTGIPNLIHLDTDTFTVTLHPEACVCDGGVSFAIWRPGTREFFGGGPRSGFRRKGGPLIHFRPLVLSAARRQGIPIREMPTTWFGSGTPWEEMAFPDWIAGKRPCRRSIFFTYPEDLSPALG